MVEIDGEVIEACKKHLPKIASAFDHPKLNLIVGDGIEYVENAKHNNYDLIVVDGSDPVGPAEGLFSVAFFNNCYKALNEGGILVAQGESPKFNEHAFADIHQTLIGLFGTDNAKVSLFYVPTYPTGMWSFQYGVKNGAVNPTEIDDDKVNSFVETHGLRYYNPEIHRASFALPGFVKDLLK